MSDVVCRGCWRLGSACGHCKRCVKSLLVLLSEFVEDDDPCQYDNNDLCQSHNLHQRPCPHEQAKHAITTAKHRLKLKI